MWLGDLKDLRALKCCNFHGNIEKKIIFCCINIVNILAEYSS